MTGFRATHPHRSGLALNDCKGEKRRILPTAIGGVEHPAIRGVHEEGAPQDGAEQPDRPGIETGEDREAADQLGQNDRPGEERETDLGQKAAKPSTMNTAISNRRAR